VSDKRVVLVVEDEELLRKVCVRLLGTTYRVLEAGTLEEATRILGDGAVDVCLCDIHLPDGDGVVELPRLRRLSRNTEFVIMTGMGGVSVAVSAVKNGAYDFLAKPFDPMERVALTVAKAIERKDLRDRADQLETESAQRNGFDRVLGSSPLLRKAMETARQAATSSVSLLILGESGTGKEVVARAVHQASTRNRGPFVVVNCGALPEALIESELFGHVKGSFTGAVSDKRGLFEEANKGTIFLDEIGEMPAAAQVRLLRVLQSGEVRRVGASDAKIVDVRVLAATNADLKAAMKEGAFREDLYYRLNVISVELPPLRNRRDDVPALALHFLRGSAKRAGRAVEGITDEAMRALIGWSWPGNVRELENTIERAVVLTRGTELDSADLPDHLFGGERMSADGERIEGETPKYQEARERALVEFDRGYIAALLRVTQGNMASAAAVAGLDRSNFRKVVVRAGIDFREFLPQRLR
jgi:DNA-binding NtrC family response regulator